MEDTHRDKKRDGGGRMGEIQMLIITFFVIMEREIT